MRAWGVTIRGTGGDKICRRSAQANVWGSGVEKSVSVRWDWIFAVWEVLGWPIVSRERGIW